jgi:hypothetical protein
MPISKIETDSLASGLVAPTATALTTASGSAPSYSARAWVNFNGTGTVAIRASGNVSSITDNGTGNYTVNYTTSMPDVNYSFVGVCDIQLNLANNPRTVQFAAFNTGSTQIMTVDNAGNLEDQPYVMCTTLR